MGDMPVFFPSFIFFSKFSLARQTMAKSRRMKQVLSLFDSIEYSNAFKEFLIKIFKIISNLFQSDNQYDKISILLLSITQQIDCSFKNNHISIELFIIYLFDNNKRLHRIRPFSIERINGLFPSLFS